MEKNTTGTIITEGTTVAEVILIKGLESAKIMDEHLCDGKNLCYPGTSLQLGVVAIRMKKTKKQLAVLLEKLNELPDK